MIATRKPAIVLAAAAQGLAARPHVKGSLRGGRRVPATTTDAPSMQASSLNMPLMGMPSVNAPSVNALSTDALLAPSRIKGNRVSKSSRSTPVHTDNPDTRDENVPSSSTSPTLPAPSPPTPSRRRRRSDRSTPRTVKVKRSPPIVLTAEERAALKDVTDIVGWIEFKGRITQRLPTREAVEDFVQERPAEMQQEYRERFGL